MRKNKTSADKEQQLALSSKKMITKDEITLSLKGQQITVPKGTRVTHKTALGYDENYHFVDDLSFLDKHSIAYHDATYSGINMPPDNVLVLPDHDCSVKFKVLDFADHRKSGSTLEIGNMYIGAYRAANNSIWWTDPGNDQYWVFWPGDTAEIAETLPDEKG